MERKTQPNNQVVHHNYFFKSQVWPNRGMTHDLPPTAMVNKIYTRATTGTWIMTRILYKIAYVIDNLILDLLNTESLAVQVPMVHPLTRILRTCQNNTLCLENYTITFSVAFSLSIKTMLRNVTLTSQTMSLLGFLCLQNMILKHNTLWLLGLLCD